MPALNGDGGVYLTNDIIASEVLRLLKNNLVYARIVSKRYESEFADVGQTINIQLPARTQSAEGRTLVIQPMVKRTVPLTIDRHRHVGFEWTVRDRTLSIGDFSNLFLRSAVAQLANVIDRAVGQEVLDASFFSSGTAGTAINVNTIIDANAKAEMTGMPRDGMTHAVLDPRDAAAISKDIKTLYNDGMVKTAVQKGYLGYIDDVNMYRSANAPTHQVGPLGGTPLVNGAAQSGASLITDGWTAAAALRLRKGDVFTIAGVFAINPQSYESTGDLQQFTVTADVSSDGAGNATIPISPAINSGAQTTPDAAGNNISTKGYKNVDALAADNAAITVVGTANTRYRYAPIFHRDALAFAAPPLAPVKSAVVSTTKVDPDTGIGISLTMAYDITNHKEISRLDVIWGTKAVYPELIHRVISAAI